MSDEFTTLAGRSRYEPDKIKGSRFIGCLAPATTEAEALAFVEEVRAEFADARHWCWAYRLGAGGEQTRSNDDGEPGGSAGRPILAQLEGHGITNAVACVVRYFGGVKLGVGGLMRAYGGAAGQAMDRAELRVTELRVRIDVQHAYGDSGAIGGVLAKYEVEPMDPEYGETVRFTVMVRAREAASFVDEVRDSTAGRARCTSDG